MAPLDHPDGTISVQRAPIQLRYFPTRQIRLVRFDRWQLTEGPDRACSQLPPAVRAARGLLATSRFVQGSIDQSTCALSSRLARMIEVRAAIPRLPACCTHSDIGAASTSSPRFRR